MKNHYGNAIGECGDSTTEAKVNAIDMLGARNNPRNFKTAVPIDFAYDYDRDARVGVVDMLIARNNTTHIFNALKPITVPGGKSGGSRVEGEGSRVDGSELRVVQSGLLTLDPGLLTEKLDWLVEFEQAGTRRRGAGEGEAVEMAVDRLLMDRWR